MSAATEDFLGCSLAYETMGSVGLRNHYRHEAAAKVEGDLIDLAVVRHSELLVDLRMSKNCTVQDVLEPRLKVAIEIGQYQYFIVVFEINIAVFLEHDPIGGQSTCLVRTEHIHRAEVLDGVEPFDDDLLARHQHRALGE